MNPPRDYSRLRIISVTGWDEHGGRGFAIRWECAGIGFGEVAVTALHGEEGGKASFLIDNEYMSREFLAALWNAMLDQSTLTHTHL